MYRHYARPFFPIDACPPQSIEALDAHGRPLLVIRHSKGCALPNNIYRRDVAVLLRVAGRKTLVRKLPSTDIHAGLWDVSTFGTVQAGESPEQAVLRLLDIPDTAEARVRQLADWLPPDALERGLVHEAGVRMTLFSAGPPPLPVIIAQPETHMLLDNDELLALLQRMPDVLSPRLIAALSLGTR